METWQIVLHRSHGHPAGRQEAMDRFDPLRNELHRNREEQSRNSATRARRWGTQAAAGFRNALNRETRRSRSGKTRDQNLHTDSEDVESL